MTIVVYLHIKGKLDLGISVWIVNFEEAVDELPQVNIPTRIQIEHREETIANDSWQLSVLYIGKQNKIRDWWPCLT